ncbi:hypothetical protein ACFE04_028304 [Oxalis oulophora]
MYPHQQEGFEFVWNSMTGGVHLEKLKNPETKNCGRGCIILSHVLGTVFLQSYMKLFPNCKPAIIAPGSILLTWEEEFKEWKKSVLGISYMLFKKLVGDDNKEISKGYAYETIKTLLLDTPDLFIFDEGHTPRNDKSRMFKALFQIKTEKHVILSGTHF